MDISRHAVRLFTEQGVAATSGEQIAQAAGVSERTFWRYFPHKESCVEPLLTKPFGEIGAPVVSKMPTAISSEMLPADLLSTSAVPVVS